MAFSFFFLFFSPQIRSLKMNKIKFLIETPNFQNKKIKIYNFIKLTDLKNL
jgi:hypothetical protein